MEVSGQDMPLALKESCTVFIVAGYRFGFCSDEPEDRLAYGYSDAPSPRDYVVWVFPMLVMGYAAWQILLFLGAMLASLRLGIHCCCRFLYPALEKRREACVEWCYSHLNNIALASHVFSGLVENPQSFEIGVIVPYNPEARTSNIPIVVPEPARTALVEIGYKLGDSLARVGVGYRVGSAIYTPRHVVSRCFDMAEKATLWTQYGSFDFERRQVVASTQFDFAYIRLPLGVMAALHLRSGKFSSTFWRQGDMHLSGPSGQRMLGRLARGKTRSEYYCYHDVSTAPGDSGAPILCRGAVVAMHLGASSLHSDKNVALDIARIQWLFQRLKGRRDILGTLSKVGHVPYSAESTTTETWSGYEDELIDEVDWLDDAEYEKYVAFADQDPIAFNKKQAFLARFEDIDPDESWGDYDERAERAFEDDMDRFDGYDYEAASIEKSLPTPSAPDWMVSLFTFATRKGYVGEGGLRRPVTFLATVKGWRPYARNALALGPLASEESNLVDQAEGFGWMDRSFSSEVRSWTFQVGRRGNNPHAYCKYDEGLRQFMIAMEPVLTRLSEEDAVKIAPPSFDFASRRVQLAAAIADGLAGDSGSKTPGAGYHVVAATNRQLWESYSPMLAEMLMQALNRLLDMPHPEFVAWFDEATAEERARAGLFFPGHMFGKDEPHPAAKIKQGRLRLVVGAFWNRTVLERTLFSWLIKPLMSEWSNSPLAPGIGLDSRRDIDALWARVRWLRSAGQVVQDDASGWDFTVHYFDWMVEQKAWLGLGRRVGAPKAWVNGVKNIDHVLTHGQVQCFSDGRIFSLGTARCIQDGKWVEMNPPHPEVTRDSGGYRTSMGNSIMRDVGSRQAGHDAGGLVLDSYSCGDDHLMATQGVELEAYKDAMSAQGKILKFADVVKPTDPVEFCSHYFHPNPTRLRKVVFGGVWKSVFKAITTAQSEQTKPMVELALKHNVSRVDSDEQDIILPILREAGFNITKKDVASPWYAD